jgi:Tfp pilus assembly protein PilF
MVLVWGAWCGVREPACARPLIIFLAMTVLVACAFRTRDQLRYWQNDETLFRHTLAVTKNNYLAYNNLGTWLSKKGQIAEAMDCFHKSLKIKPDDSDVLYNLGNAFAKLGNWDEAINNYQRALQIIPNQPDILDNLGFAFAARKQFADAIACFEAALKLDPDSADAHNNLATVLFIQKRFDEAIRHYREALRLQPDNPQIYSNLGDAQVKQGQTAEACGVIRRRCGSIPAIPKSRQNYRCSGRPSQIEIRIAPSRPSTASQIENILPQAKRHVVAQIRNGQQPPRVFRLRNNFEQVGLRLPPGVAGGFDRHLVGCPFPVQNRGKIFPN